METLAMTTRQLINLRLQDQQIAVHDLKTPADVVKHLGAMQAQEYGLAKWAIGLRLPGAVEDDIEQALNEGEILRTHLLRSTWHFVAREDIRWMLSLTAPRIDALNGSMYRKLGLDEDSFKKSTKALLKILQGGRQLTRTELAAELQKEKIRTDDLRFTFLMMRAELDGVVCNGSRQGKQFTYALLDDRVPYMPMPDRDDALADLTLRYLTSRGPATVYDLAWWSGLTVGDAKIGLEMNSQLLEQSEVDRQTYWFRPGDRPAGSSSAVYLLPTYDEYIIGYKDRSMLIDAKHTEDRSARENIVFSSVVIVNGRIAGTWRRAVSQQKLLVQVRLFRPGSKALNTAIAASAGRYGKFLGMKTELELA